MTHLPRDDSPDETRLAMVGLLFRLGDELGLTIESSARERWGDGWRNDFSRRDGGPVNVFDIDWVVTEYLYGDGRLRDLFPVNRETKGFLERIRTGRNEWFHNASFAWTSQRLRESATRLAGDVLELSRLMGLTCAVVTELLITRLTEIARGKRFTGEATSQVAGIRHVSSQHESVFLTRVAKAKGLEDEVSELRSENDRLRAEAAQMAQLLGAEEEFRRAMDRDVSTLRPFDLWPRGASTEAIRVHALGSELVRSDGRGLSDEFGRAPVDVALRWIGSHVPREARFAMDPQGRIAMVMPAAKVGHYLGSLREPDGFGQRGALRAGAKVGAVLFAAAFMVDPEGGISDTGGRSLVEDIGVDRATAVQQRVLAGLGDEVPAIVHLAIDGILVRAAVEGHWAYVATVNPDNEWFTGFSVT